MGKALAGSFHPDAPESGPHARRGAPRGGVLRKGWYNPAEGAKDIQGRINVARNRAVTPGECHPKRQKKRVGECSK